MRHKAAGETIAELRIELQEAADENGRLLARLVEASSAAASTAEEIASINEVILMTSADLESLDERLQATLEELHRLNGDSQDG